MKPQPLRTHGKTVERWVPPKTQFITYEAKDEDWAKPLGIGHTVHDPLDLFDVRDKHGDLIGYTSWDPSKQIGYRVDLPVMSGRRNYDWSGPDVAAPQSVETITVETRLWRVRAHSDTYITWVVDARNAEALIRAGWINTLGEDNRGAFIQEIQRRETMWER